ncbi:hypothetical protein RMQ97_14775 [Maricaulis sp. D1M11]|uniref:hypothetical protein n=1 Tax=Maricaulis sp. D1M11 TaxID=3076117 RepID=UPI0039B5F19F
MQIADTELPQLLSLYRSLKWTDRWAVRRHLPAKARAELDKALQTPVPDDTRSPDRSADGFDALSPEFSAYLRQQLENRDLLPGERYGSALIAHLQHLAAAPRG